MRKAPYAGCPNIIISSTPFEDDGDKGVNLSFSCPRGPELDIRGLHRGPDGFGRSMTEAKKQLNLAMGGICTGCVFRKDTYSSETSIVSGPDGSVFEKVEWTKVPQGESPISSQMRQIAEAPVE